jgi:hypothetical protein
MKFRKKRVTIDAVQYTKGMEDAWAWLSGDGGHRFYSTQEEAFAACTNEHLRKNIVPIIKTLEGFHEISPGDWIITGVKGERYPCKPDIFEMTYEPIREPSDSEPIEGTQQVNSKPR